MLHQKSKVIDKPESMDSDDIYSPNTEDDLKYNH